jgi:hypothetical protein
MAGISQKCVDFLANLADNIDQLYTNPAVSRSEAAQAAAEAMTNSLKDPTVRARVGTFIRNSYLSALSTQVVNFANNLVQVVAAPVLRAAGGRPGESVAMVQGITEGFLEAFPRFFGGLGRRTEDFDGNALTNFDIVRNKYADAALTYPQRVTGALDQAFSAVLERMEFRAMLHRIENKFPDEYFTARGTTRQEFVQELQNVAMKRNDGNAGFLKLLEARDPALYQQLQEFAAFNTFRNPLGKALLDRMGTAVSKAKNEAPELNLVVPFIRTGVNVFKEAGGYIPGAGMLRVRQAKKDIADLENQISKLASQETKAREKAANAIFPGQAEGWLAKAENFQKRREKLEGTAAFKEEKIPEFYAQQVMGAGLMMATYGMVESGMITGHYSTDPATRNRQMASKIPEMSIRIGDRWVSYNRVEPFSTIMGLVVDGMQALKEGRIKGEGPGVSDITKIVGVNLLDKTFTEGLGKAMLAIQEPERYGAAYAVSLANPVVPAVVNQIARIQDPVQRETKDPELTNWIMNSLQARIPGIREQLPAATNVAGQERQLSGTVTGIQNVPVSQDSVNKLFDNPYLRLGTMQRTVGGLDLSTEQYAEMQATVGQYTNEALSYLADDPAFTSLPLSIQATFIKGLVTDIRKNIRLQTLNTLIADPELRAQYILNEMRKKGMGSLIEEEE